MPKEKSLINKFEDAVTYARDRRDLNQKVQDWSILNQGIIILTEFYADQLAALKAKRPNLAWAINPSKCEELTTELIRDESRTVAKIKILILLKKKLGDFCSEDVNLGAVGSYFQSHIDQGINDFLMEDLNAGYSLFETLMGDLNASYSLFEILMGDLNARPLLEKFNELLTPYIQLQTKVNSERGISTEKHQRPQLQQERINSDSPQALSSQLSESKVLTYTIIADYFDPGITASSSTQQQPQQFPSASVPFSTQNMPFSKQKEKFGTKLTPVTPNNSNSNSLDNSIGLLKIGDSIEAKTFGH